MRQIFFFLHCWLYKILASTCYKAAKSLMQMDPCPWSLVGCTGTWDKVHDHQCKHFLFITPAALLCQRAFLCLPLIAQHLQTRLAESLRQTLTPIPQPAPILNSNLLSPILNSLKQHSPWQCSLILTWLKSHWWLWFTGLPVKSLSKVHSCIFPKSQLCPMKLLAG